MATMTPEKIQARKDKAAENAAARERGEMPPKKKSAKAVVPKDMYTLIVKEGELAGTHKMKKGIFDLVIAGLKKPTDKTLNIVITDEIKAAINDVGNSQVTIYGGGFIIEFKKQ